MIQPRGLFLWVAVGILTLGVSDSRADLLQELSPAQQGEVRSGKQVTVLQEVPGEPWPRVTIYRIIPSTPGRVTAVFFDYKNAANYIPKVLKSVVSKDHSSSVTDVDYELSVPILPDEFYTVQNRLTRLPNGGYLISWHLLRAVQTKASTGEFRAVPYGKDTLLRYRILTTPSSGMAGILRGKAIDMIKDTVAAIAKEIEKQQVQDPAGLEKRVQALQAAL
ncbi:MAG: hypothetical protein WEB60_08470 [Terrimicrobiaceae bacterium]